MCIGQGRNMATQAYPNIKHLGSDHIKTSFNGKTNKSRIFFKETDKSGYIIV